MKKLFIIMLALLMLSLCACGKTQESSPTISELETVPPTEEPPWLDKEELYDDPSPEEEPAPAETEVPPAETEAPSSLIDTKYYTLTLPNEWIGKTLCDLHERDDGSYSMSVHEIQDFCDFGGGTLFTLMMLPTTEDYTIFPSYELIGALDTPTGSFNVVALFPTDVQFSQENADTYNALYEQVYDVLYTISPKDNVELAMP